MTAVKPKQGATAMPVPIRKPVEPRRLGRQPGRLAEMIGVTLNTQPPFFDALVKATAAAANLTPAQILSGLRERRIVHYRQAAIWIAYHATALSLPEIGRRFGRDHTTVLHAIRSVNSRLDAEPDDHGATVGIVRRIALNFVRRTRPPTRVDQIKAAAEAMDARQRERAEQRAQAKADGVKTSLQHVVGSRAWFEKNDAAFSAAMAAVHPERAAAKQSGAA